MDSTQPTIDWTDILGHHCLRFTFQESLSPDGARAGVAAWREAFAAEPTDQLIDLLWDCAAMERYDARAFSLWRSTLVELRPRISEIWMVSGSSLVRTGGMMLGIMTGIKVHTVASHTALAEKIGDRPKQ